VTRRSAYLASFSVALAAFAGIVSPAQSDDPPPTQLLPNLRQELPSDVKVAHIGATWRLGFASEVTNEGPGYLKITGAGPGNAPMDAEQVVEMSDGSQTTVPDIGQLHYVIASGHEHWHLLDFERYELRRASDPDKTILRDQKTGFCLADAFTADVCGRNQPELTAVSEGIAAGGSDKYVGYLEGQYIPLDRATVPTGDYLLVNRVNPTGALLDEDATDDMATVRLSLRWVDGAPALEITNSCMASIACDGPTTEPDPGPDPITPTPEPVVPLPEPEPVPVVPPAQFAPATAKASMSRSMAGRLVRRAIQKSLNATPRGLRTRCERRSAQTFRCSSTWYGARTARWTGRIRVSYRLRDGKLAWFYDLTARRSPGGKRVVRRAAQGGASRAIFSGATGALYCAVPPR
jgi:hypothetical protein